MVPFPAEDVEELDGVTLHHRYVDGDRVTLHVVTAGDGPPVVLLHGFPEGWWAWRHQIPALVRGGYRVWVPDLRGYGRSDRPVATDAYALRHLVADVVALVGATGTSRAHIVGHDWGGIIAWTLAGHHPERVEKLLILNAPHLDIYTHKVWRTTQALRSAYVPFFAMRWLPARMLSAGRFLLLRTLLRRTAVRPQAHSEADIQRYVEAWSQPGALAAALAYYRANISPGPLTWARASRVGAETLVIWALADPSLSPGLLDGLETVAPNSRVHRVPDCGHWVQAEAAAEVNGVMLDFLEAPGRQGTNP